MACDPDNDALSRFDELETQLSELYDDVKQMMNDDDKEAEVILLPLREINHLYVKLQFMVMDVSDKSIKTELNEKLQAQHVIKSNFDKEAKEYLACNNVALDDCASAITAPRTLRSRAGLSRRSSASELFQANSVSQLQEKQRLEWELEEKMMEMERVKAEYRRKRLMLEATQELQEASLEVK